MRQGRFSSIVEENSYTLTISADNISIAFGTEIENAVGSAHDDLIIGNHLNNILDGGEGTGNDIIFGSGNIDDSADGGYLAARNNEADADYTYRIYDDAADPDYGTTPYDNKDGGDDLIFGRDGDDKLWGGEGHDILLGGTGTDILHSDDDKSGGNTQDQPDILDGGDDADVYHVGEGDVIANLEAGDAIYYNGQLLFGGKDYFAYLTSDHQQELGNDLPYEFVGQQGEAYGFFVYNELMVGDSVAYDVGMAILLPNATKPVLIYGVEYEITDRSLHYEVDGDGDLGFFVGLTLEVEGGLFTFEDWRPEDTNGTNDSEEAAHVPQFAKDAYDHQYSSDFEANYFTHFAEGGLPGRTLELDLTHIQLEALGYNFRTHTWNEQQLIEAWRGAEAQQPTNGGDQGHLSNPDGTNHADANGNPAAPGEAIVAVAAAIGAASSLNTPLVLDLDGDGIELTSLVQSKAYFDLDANGFAQRTGWVTGGDGLLAIDANDNGNIGDVNELFGSTEAYGSATTDGFDALSALDDNLDGKVDLSDAKFSDLRVWIDADEDGYTDKGELKTLAEVGIESISLSTTASGATVAGNLISDTATYTKSGGGTGMVGDAWLSNSSLDTVDVRDATIPPAIMLMPAMRGYGEVGGLRLEMSRNPELFDAVTNLVLHQHRNNGAFPSNLLSEIGGIGAVLGWRRECRASRRLCRSIPSDGAGAADWHTLLPDHWARGSQSWPECRGCSGESMGRSGPVRRCAVPGAEFVLRCLLLGDV